MLDPCPICGHADHAGMACLFGWKRGDGDGCMCGPIPSPSSVAKQRAKDARASGYSGDACPDCGQYTVHRNGDARKCVSCGGAWHPEDAPWPPDPLNPQDAPVGSPASDPVEQAARALGDAFVAFVRELRRKQ